MTEKDFMKDFMKDLIKKNGLKILDREYVEKLLRISDLWNEEYFKKECIKDAKQFCEILAYDSEFRDHFKNEENYIDYKIKSVIDEFSPYKTYAEWYYWNCITDKYGEQARFSKFCKLLKFNGIINDLDHFVEYLLNDKYK